MSSARTLPISVLAVLVMAGLACAQISFAPPVFYPTGVFDSYLFAEDFDGDGDIDVALAGPATASLFRNTGGVLGPREPSFTGPYLCSETTCTDFDGDGDMDLVSWGALSGTSQLLLVLKANDGMGNFSASSTIGISHGSSHIISGDVNGDLAPDLVMTSTSTIHIYLSGGAGPFTAGQSFTSLGIGGVALADMDGDGDNDVVATQASYASGAIVWWNNGLGDFSQGPSVPFYSQPSSYGPSRLVVTDLDNNGSPDLGGNVRGLPTQPPVLGGGFSISLASGPGIYAPSIFYPAGRVPERLRAADLDGDGFPEIILSDFDLDSVFVMQNSASGAFSSAATLAVGTNPMEVITADINADGLADIVVHCVYSHELAVLINQTQPTGSVIPYPGSGEDLRLLSGINWAATTGTGNYVKTAVAGDAVGLLTVSPGGSFYFDPLFVVGDLFPTGGTPGSVPGFSSFHFDLTRFIFLAGAPGNPFQLALSPGGYYWMATVPPGLAGFSVMTQSVVLSQAATAGFAASDAHEIQVLQ